MIVSGVLDNVTSLKHFTVNFCKTVWAQLFILHAQMNRKTSFHVLITWGSNFTIIIIIIIHNAFETSSQSFFLMTSLEGQCCGGSSKCS